MKKKNIHIVPNSGQWGIKRDDSERISELFETQEKAVNRGRSIAKRDRVELFIHDRDGQIIERDSYGNDPYPPEG
jgi:hypothetical protein